MLGKGQETPENIVLTRQKDFSYRLVEAVEKAPKHILRRDAERSDLIECAAINDLMPGKCQVTPEKHPLIVVRGRFLQAR